MCQKEIILTSGNWSFYSHKYICKSTCILHTVCQYNSGIGDTLINKTDMRAFFSWTYVLVVVNILYYIDIVRTTKKIKLDVNMP